MYEYDMLAISFNIEYLYDMTTNHISLVPAPPVRRIMLLVCCGITKLCPRGPLTAAGRSDIDSWRETLSRVTHCGGVGTY